MQVYALAGHAHAHVGTGLASSCNSAIDLVQYSCLSLANIVLIVVKYSKPSVRHYSALVH